MKTITMYELLGLVKDGKAPKKIKYKNTIYELDDKKMIWADEVYHGEGKDYMWLNFKHIESLNDEVEIIEEEPRDIEVCGSLFTKSEYDKLAHCEEEKKIPEKFKVHSFGDKDENGCFVSSPFPTDEEFMDKINEIIDYLDYLKSKGEYK